MAGPGGGGCGAAAPEGKIPEGGKKSEGLENRRAETVEGGGGREKLKNSNELCLFDLSALRRRNGSGEVKLTRGRRIAGGTKDIQTRGKRKRKRKEIRENEENQHSTAAELTPIKYKRIE